MMSVEGNVTGVGSCVLCLFHLHTAALGRRDR